MRHFIHELFETVSIAKIMFYTALVVVSTYYAIEKVEAHYNNHNPWEVVNANAGFALVENSKGQQAVVRNPVPEIEVGNIVTVVGFGVFTGQDLPYIRYKVYDYDISTY